MKRSFLIGVLSLALLLVFSGASFAQFGSISGRVTDDSTGLPIMGAHVWAKADTTQSGGYGFDFTDSSGFYRIDSLYAGEFLVFANAQGYGEETYPDSVIVIAGQNAPNIDFALSLMGGMGSISGRVTDEETDLPLPMAHLWAQNIAAAGGGEAWSDTAGLYLLQNLPAGQYVVGVHKDGYGDEVYPDTLIVEEGQNTPNIDFALTPTGSPDYGSISGRVTDQVTGLPLMGAHLVATGLDTYCFGEAWSDSNGYYIIDDLCVGIWQVQASRSGYYTQTYPDSVSVVEGQTTDGIDFALTPIGTTEFGSISGRVTDEQTGLPIIMGEITLTGIYSIWYTDTAGYYFCDSLPSDCYYVNAQKEGYAPGTYPDSVFVAAGENMGGIDFALTSIVYGDADGNGTVHLADVVYLINYLLRSGPSPLFPLEACDVNCDFLVDLGDVVYLIDYLFRGGPEPSCPPTGNLVDFTGCKTLEKATFINPVPPDQDCIEYQYDGEGVLLIKHVNAGFNCCPDDILADVTIEDNVITIEESESLESGGCYCLCLFDLDLKITNLEPGEYTIKVLQLYLYPDDELLEFTIDLSPSPSSGSHCMTRDHYPWGIW